MRKWTKGKGEPVEWRVLDKKDGEMLLLSEYGLDAQPFDTSGKSRVDWKDSTIRKWLNDDSITVHFQRKKKRTLFNRSQKALKNIIHP